MVDYTYFSAANGFPSYSIIDHFVCDKNMFKVIKEAGVIHDSQNLSNHSAIFCKLQMSNLEVNHTENSHVDKVSWERANKDARSMFKDMLRDKLSSIQTLESSHCSDLFCDNKRHINDLDNYTMEVLKSMEITGANCLSRNKTKQRKNTKSRKLPGWNEYVRPLADESSFWFNLWKSSGKPTQGQSNPWQQYEILRLQDKCAFLIVVCEMLFGHRL